MTGGVIDGLDYTDKWVLDVIMSMAWQMELGFDSGGHVCLRNS